jgi:hypothetical protein
VLRPEPDLRVLFYHPGQCGLVSAQLPAFPPKNDLPFSALCSARIRTHTPNEAAENRSLISSRAARRRKRPLASSVCCVAALRRRRPDTTRLCLPPRHEQLQICLFPWPIHGQQRSTTSPAPVPVLGVGSPCLPLPRVVLSMEWVTVPLHLSYCSQQ